MKHFRVEGNQITFIDSRFYYEGGIFCPSVSTILEAYPKDYGFYKWLKETGEEADRIKELAGEKGSNVHKMTEQYDQGLEVSLVDESGRQTWSMAEWSMFTRYTEFRAQVAPAMKIHQIEMNLVDVDLREGGTLDRYVDIDGKHMIIDIKTSNAIYPSYWLQLAAYRRMFQRKSGIAIDAVGILWLNAKTRGTAVNKIQGQGWQLLLKEDSSDDLELYDCTKKLWWSQNKNVAPKDISYKLTHKL
jgi:hypothetical protein